MPTKKKPREGYKHSGTFNLFTLSENDFDCLSKILGETISEEYKEQLQEAGSNYYLNHHAIDNKVGIPEIKAACELVTRQGSTFAQTLEDLDDTSLDKISIPHERDILEIHERLQNDLEVFINATKTWLENRKKFEEEHPQQYQGRPKDRSALKMLAKDLIPIFEGITSETATSTYNELYKEGLFVTFTRYCIHKIQKEIIGDHAIVKAIQAALKNR